MNFINITNHLPAYKTRIYDFLDTLDTEKKFFSSIGKEMVMKSDLVVAAMENNEIVGIAGLERKYFIRKSYILLKKGFHGKGLGKRFKIRQLEEAAKEHDMVMAVIKEKNVKTLKLNLAVGSRIIGRRRGHVYVITPLSARGRFLYLMMRMMFPLLKIVDRFRP